jgi:outer membrane lipoprotein-sorting protein
MEIWNNIMKHLLTLALLLACSLSAFAVSDEQADQIFQRMLAAQKAHDYAAFVADADDNLKAALSQTQFDAAANLLSKRFEGGYEVTFLGELNQKGYQVFLYRLRMKDGGDDLLGTMSIKYDKVGGILFH